MHVQINDINETKKRLDIYSLIKGMPGITPPFGEMCAEAGAVCLEDRGHACGVKLSVNGSFKETFELRWSSVQDQIRRCYHDTNPATECGACGLAFLLIRTLTDYTIISRSMKGSGFDYWLGHDDDELFQGKSRLEVSGLRHGSEGEINYRVKEKLEQTSQSDETNIPAIVIVIEFGNPQARVVSK